MAVSMQRCNGMYLPTSASQRSLTERCRLEKPPARRFSDCGAVSAGRSAISVKPTSLTGYPTDNRPSAWARHTISGHIHRKETRTRASTTSLASGGGNAPETPVPMCSSRNNQKESSGCQKLGPGVKLDIEGWTLEVVSPLGEGSFGIVWAAKDRNGRTVAVKEIPCKSERALERVVAEGRLLRQVEKELRYSGSPCLKEGRVPLLVATDTQVVHLMQWKVRLVMTQVPGIPLERFLEAHRQAEKNRGNQPVENFPQQMAAACHCAGELLVQLVPTLEAFSARVYHRDVTPRNIHIQEGVGEGSPQFGLVDFGLAVDASKWRAQSEGCGELGGDGRYWPASAWFVFGFGGTAIQRHPAMFQEYRTSLDVHSLGLTALRTLMEMMPNIDNCPEILGSGSALMALRILRSAWCRYWSDARRFWQPVYDAFRGNGDFESLRAAYASASVQRMICADIVALRHALVEVKRACEEVHPQAGLVGMPSLIDTLLLMLQAAREGETAPSRHNAGVTSRENRKAPQSRSSVSLVVSQEEDTTFQTQRPLSKWASSPTVTPDSSPSSASSGFQGTPQSADEEASTTAPSSSPSPRHAGASFARFSPRLNNRRAPKLSEAWGPALAAQTNFCGNPTAVSSRHRNGGF